jgi:hypothetical protein
VTQIFYNGQPSHGGDRTIFEVMTSTLPQGTLGSVASLCFVDRFMSFCTFSFGHCVVFLSSKYGFWLPLWYLQTLLIIYSLVSASAQNDDL